MRILIATAGRHGGTQDIGRQLGVAIREGLRSRGIAAETDVKDAGSVAGISDYDAVVIGSAVYMGRWCKSARRLIDRAEPDLGLIPIWLFSSGPVDGGPTPDSNTKWDNVPWAIAHKTFGGRLVRADLTPMERTVVRLLRAKDGDARSSPEIAAWADTICAGLTMRATVADRS